MSVHALKHDVIPHVSGVDYDVKMGSFFNVNVLLLALLNYFVAKLLPPILPLPQIAVDELKLM